MPTDADYKNLDGILRKLGKPWVLDALRESGYVLAGATEAEATFVAGEGRKFMLKRPPGQDAGGVRQGVRDAKRWLSSKPALALECLALAAVAIAVWHASWVTLLLLLSFLGGS